MTINELAAFIGPNDRVEQWLTQDEARRFRSRRHAADNPLVGKCCYALHSPPARVVKIGMSVNLIDRWSSLETSSPWNLELLAMWRTETPAAKERELHERFNPHHAEREWFHETGVMEYLEGVHSDLFADFESVEDREPARFRWPPQEDDDRWRSETDAIDDDDDPLADLPWRHLEHDAELPWRATPVTERTRRRRRGTRNGLSFVPTSTPPREGG